MFLIRKILGLVLTVMLTLTPHGGTLFADSPQEPKISGKTLRLGWYGEPAPLNPFQATDTISVPLFDLIFNRLIRIDSNGNYEPDLAERWEVSDDGKTYTFYLKTNVKFHDGTECTAEDVVYTLRLLMNPATNQVVPDRFEIIKDVKALSETIVEINLEKPHAPFLMVLAGSSYIVPKHLFRNFEEDIKAFERHPVGTGPFQFAGMEGAEYIDLMRNGHYFESTPAIENIRVHFFENKRQIWSAFLRDELDVVTHLNRVEYQDLKDHPRVYTYKALHISGYVLLFNVQNDMIQEKQIRQAIAYAIDRPSIISDLEGGEGAILTGPFHPGSLGFNENVQPEPYNPQVALELLHEAGFIQGQDGVLVRDGEKFVLWMVIDHKNDYLYQIGKLIRQQLQEIGIMVKFNFYENHEELWKKANVRENLFHCLLIRMNLASDPDLIANYWHSKGIGNIGMFAHSEIDELFKNAREEYKRDKRAAYYRQIHQIIDEEKPAVFLYVPYMYHATSARVLNASALSSAYFQMYMIKDFEVSIKN